MSRAMRDRSQYRPSWSARICAALLVYAVSLWAVEHYGARVGKWVALMIGGM
jgi:hypothetical protein